MDTVETRLQQARAKQQEKARLYAQAEAKLDAVRAQKASLLKGLKDQGFEDAEQARKRVQELSSEVDQILAEIEEKVSSL